VLTVYLFRDVASVLHVYLLRDAASVQICGLGPQVLGLGLGQLSPEAVVSVYT
jgi:hypothetical protein